MQHGKWSDEELSLLRKLCKRRMTWRERRDKFAENGFDRTPSALKSMAGHIGCMPIRGIRQAPSDVYESKRQGRYEDHIIDYVAYVEDIHEWRY